MNPGAHLLNLQPSPLQAVPAPRRRASARMRAPSHGSGSHAWQMDRIQAMVQHQLPDQGLEHALALVRYQARRDADSELRQRQLETLAPQARRAVSVGGAALLLLLPGLLLKALLGGGFLFATWQYDVLPTLLLFCAGAALFGWVFQAMVRYDAVVNSMPRGERRARTFVLVPVVALVFGAMTALASSGYAALAGWAGSDEFHVRAVKVLQLRRSAACHSGDRRRADAANSAA